MVISVLRFDGSLVRGRAAGTASLDFLHLRVTVFIAAFDHGLGGCPIGVTLIAPLLALV
jgi:hypothetical protein